MKKILLSVAALCAITAAKAAFYVSCTAGGQMYSITTNSTGITSWSPAGGCAGGPWMMELTTCRACSSLSLPFDQNMTNKLAVDLNVAFVSTIIPPDILADATAKLEAGVFTQTRIELDQLSIAQQEYILSAF